MALVKVSLAGAVTALGGLVGYFLVGQLHDWLPYFLAVASSSFVYVALADLIPQLQKRLSARETMAQIVWLSAKPLLRTSLSDDTSKDTVMLAVEIAAGGTTGRHFHHGDEYAFVLQGTLELVAEGRETRRVTVGDAFHNPRGLIHEAKNAGDTPVRLHIVFVVDKGKPIIESVAK
jgi:quercetin dioxygenase-like cupin family protein